MTKLRSNKVFAIFVALSVAVIAAGIILYALMGFNYAQDKPKAYVVEISYGATVVNGEVSDGVSAEDYLQEKCEEIFEQQGLRYTDKTSLEGVSDSGSGFSPNENGGVRYTFSADSDVEKFGAAQTAVEAFLAAETAPAVANGMVVVSYAPVSNLALTKAAWRGAIAIAVGAIVALAYLTIRFGVSCGVAGLVCCAHDALFTAAFFALTRIPLFSFAPLLYAAVAALLSVILWTIVCIVYRTGKKDPANAGLNASALTDKALSSCWKYVLCAAAAVMAVIAVLGLVAVAGTRSLVLPALIAALAPVYSSLVLGPRVFVPLRTKFDRRRADKKGGYFARKKKAETQTKE